MFILFFPNMLFGSIDSISTRLEHVYLVVPIHFLSKGFFIFHYKLKFGFISSSDLSCLFYFNIIIDLAIGKSCLGLNKQAFHDRAHLNLYSSSKSVRNIKLFFCFKVQESLANTKLTYMFPLRRAYIGLSVTSRLGCGCRPAYRARQPDPAHTVGCCCSLCARFWLSPIRAFTAVSSTRRAAVWRAARPSFVMQAWPCNGGPTNRERQGGPTNTVDAGVELHMYPCFFTSSDHRGSVAIAILRVYGDLPRKTNLAASEAVRYYIYIYIYIYIYS
jgi:hypothetical protein